MSNGNRLREQIAEVRGQIAEVKTETALAPGFRQRPLSLQGVNLCNLTSDLCNLVVNYA
jgi:hypothetical protein